MALRLWCIHTPYVCTLITNPVDIKYNAINIWLL